MAGNDDNRFQEALRRFDAENARDPRREPFQGRQQPKELLYGRRMSAWLERLAPDASEPLRLAVRCQHLRRWEIPRADFPPGRAGYHRWRSTLARFHAEEAGRILQAVGYEEETVARVQALVRKERLQHDTETQLLEDTACLVFLEHTFAAFAREHEREKLLEILRKTWRKMSLRAQAAALDLDLPPEARALVDAAVGPGSHRQDAENAEKRT